MRRIFYLLAFLCFLPISARSQGGFTTVTGTITDPNGVKWSCGTISAQLITAGGAAPTLNGGGFTTQTSPVSLGCPTTPGSGANGSFAMRLADSGVISPSNTTWRFTVNTTGNAPPLGTGPQSFTFTTAINCSTNTPSTCTSNQLDISTQLSALAPALGGGGGGSITSVSSLPATCTAGSSQPVQLTVAITVGNPPIPYGAGTVFYCDTTNHYSPVSQGSGASPVMGYYLSAQCPPSNQGYCFNTPANTQISNICNYTFGSAVVTCQTAMLHNIATVAANVATYTTVLTGGSGGSNGAVGSGSVPVSWAIGNSITITSFPAGDTFFNQTCTISAVTATSVSCPLVHANASSGAGSFGAILNTSAGPFVAGDQGKRIFGYGNCAAYAQLQANSHNQPITTSAALTISTVNSSLQVTMSGTSANSTASSNGCVIWGNPDDAGATAMDAAMLASPICPRAHLAAAFYLFTAPHFYLNPWGCAFLPTLNATGTLAAAAGGNAFYSGGFEVEGRGAGATTIFLPPAFPESGSCNNGKSGLACFVVPVEGRFSNFQLSGGGNYSSPNFTNGQMLVEISGPGSLDYVNCTNFGGGTPGTFGLVGFVWAQFQQTISSACGDANYGSTSSTVTGFRIESANCYTYCWFVGVTQPFANNNAQVDGKYSLVLYDPFFVPGQIPILDNMIRDSLGTGIKLYHAKFSVFDTVTNGDIAYLCGPAGCLLDMEDTSMDMTSGGTGVTTGDFGVFCASACTVVSKNSLIKGSTAGGSFAYRDTAGSKFISEGDNTLGAMSISATSLLSLSSIDFLSGATGITPTCPTVTGATATCAAIAGSTNEKGTLRMTVTAAGTASGTVTMNFVGTFSQTTTPSCNFNPANTGTGAWNARATTILSTRSSTAPVISWDNNAAALGNLTWDIDYACSLR
jgi:hypothetical protein